MKKNHYYVLVMTDEGPVFVTKIENSNRVAHFDKAEKPLDLSSKSYAEDLAFGLCCNFHLAYAICVGYEISGQPYNYAQGGFEWKWKEDAEENGQNN